MVMADVMDSTTTTAAATPNTSAIHNSNMTFKRTNSASIPRTVPVAEPWSDEAPPWGFAQCFGDKEEEEDVSRINDGTLYLMCTSLTRSFKGDLISTVAFDQTGDFLASGDRAGRVVLFQRNTSSSNNNNSNSTSKRSNACTYSFYAEFQSHEPEFDYLKSLEINERINRIAWCRRVNDAHHILTTNDKTVKLWKVRQRSVHAVVENNASIAQRLAHSAVQLPLCLPRTMLKEPVVTAVPRSVYANAHTYNLHSISPAADGELFLSADDLRINLWNLQDANDRCYNLVDMKPNNLEELNEVITSATFHPSHGHLFAYATSRGSVRLCDMREAALCDPHARHFRAPQIDPDLYYGNPSINGGGGNGIASTTSDPTCFREIVTSISDLKFSPCGRYFLTRDYLHLHLWDTHMERQPILTQAVHPAVVPKLCDLYENDYIFDKFECGWTGDGRSIVSGSYNNYLRIFPSSSLGGSGRDDQLLTGGGSAAAAIEAPPVMVRRGGGQVVQATKVIFRSKRAGKAAAIATHAALLSPMSAGGGLGGGADATRRAILHPLDWIPPPPPPPPHSLSRSSSGRLSRPKGLGSKDGSITSGSTVTVPHINITANSSSSSSSASPSPSLGGGVIGGGGGGPVVLDWDRKIQYLSVHPRENIVALAALSNLFIFTQPNHQQQQQNPLMSLSSSAGSSSSQSIIM